MYQKIIIIGRLGSDPASRFTQSGTQVTSFSVATDRRWTDSNGQQQERTVWFRVSAWRKLGELCNQYLAKGRLVMVEGTLDEPKPYQGKDGEWRASLDVTAREVKFLGGRNEGQQQGSAQATPTPTPTTEEEIPF